MAGHGRCIGHRMTPTKTETHENLVARASITINAPRAAVWHALVTPSAIKQYMFGADVESDWIVGDPITWKGEWQGQKYEDKGVLLRVDPQRDLRYSHYSPLSGLPDSEENYHIVDIQLAGTGGPVKVILTQDKNPTEEAVEHAQKNWKTMLKGLKKHVERLPS